MGVRLKPMDGKDGGLGGLLSLGEFNPYTFKCDVVKVGRKKEDLKQFQAEKFKGPQNSKPRSTVSMKEYVASTSSDLSLLFQNMLIMRHSQNMFSFTPPAALSWPVLLSSNLIPMFAILLDIL